MRSGPLYLVVWMLIACLAGGCVLPGTAKSTAQDNPPISKEDKDAAKKLAQKSKKNPKTDPSKTVAKKKDKDSPKSSDDTPTVKAGDKVAANHSASTKALIQSELRDAPPAEREEMMKSLEGVPDDMVPKVLNAWRMSQQMQQRRARAESLAKGDSNSDRNSIERAGAESANPFDDPKLNQNQMPPQSGLGSRTPWNQGSNQPGSTSFDATSASNRDMSAAARAAALGLAASRAANPPADNLYASASPNGYPPSVRGNPQIPIQNLPNGYSGNQASGYPPNNGYQQQNPIQLGQPVYGADGSGQPYQNGYNQNAYNAPNGAPNQGQQNYAQQPYGNNPQQSPPLGRLNPGQYGGAPPSTYGRQPQDPRFVNTNLPVPGASGFNPPSGYDAAAVNQAAFAQGAGWPEYLQRLIAMTESEVAQLTPGNSDPERQRYIEKHVYLRMLYMMSGQHERALNVIPTLDPADQEFWQQMFWGIANYFDGREIPDPALRATETIQQINQAILKLKDKAHLELRNVTFCHKISSFGDYEKFPRDEFVPGRELLVYAELGNFHSEMAADGKYRTVMKSTLEIHKPGPQGELIHQIPYQPTEDLCRNHRRDYYHSYKFEIPPKVAPGQYLLKLIVEDQLSHKVATKSLNFTVTKSQNFTAK